MAITVRELVTKIGFKVNKESFNKAQRSSQRMKKILRGVGIGAAAIGTALVGIGVAAVKSAADMEMMTTQFEVMLGSTEKANALMEKLKKFSAATPFQLPDLAKGTGVLLSAGVATEDVIDTMRMLGDTAGGNTEKLKGLVLGYQKMESTGKASLEVLNIFAERGVPIFAEVQKNLGLTKEEFFKMVSAGKIGTQDITNAFKTMTSEGGMFFQGMEKASLTLTGMISTMKDVFNLLLADIGKGLLPVIKEFVGLLTELAKGPLAELGKGLGAVLVPIFQSLAQILPKLIKFLVPILMTVGELLGKLLTGLMPVFDLLEPILELVEALMPILEVVVDILVELMPILVFVLKIVAKILTIAAKGLSFTVKLWWKFWKGIIKGVKSGAKFFIKIFKSILKPIKGVISAIGGFFGKIWDTIAISINKAIDIFNKLVPKRMEIRTRLSTFESAQKASQQQAGGKTTNITAPIKADINVKVTGEKTASPRAIGGAVKDGVKQAFNLELQKVIVAAMG